jgi:dienelactone hydrolase
MHRGSVAVNHGAARFLPDSAAMTRRRPATIAIIGIVLALGTGAACSSSSDDEPAAPASTTTTTPSSPAPYAELGPYAVGFTGQKLPDGRRVVVWYPAEPGQTDGHDQQTINLAGMLTPELQELIPAEQRVKYQGNAYLDAPPATDAAPYPVVIFSHGFAGYPEQSLDMTTHLASWGFVVAAPNHVDRSLDGVLGTAGRGVAPKDDVAVLQDTLALLEQQNDGDGVLQGLSDPERVVAAGHSAGAGATYRFASADPRVKAWIAYSVGFGGRGGPPPAAPKQPGMVMLGTTDGIIEPAASEQVYAGMNRPKYLVKVGNGGHLVFSDICLIGRESGGITAIAKSLNLPIPESLLKLGSDGCEDTHPPVEEAFPAIDQLSVAFFRNALGIDDEPVGLDTDAVSGLGADVTVEHDTGTSVSVNTTTSTP